MNTRLRLVWLAAACSSFASGVAEEMTSTCSNSDLQRVASSAPVLLTVRHNLKRRGFVLLQRNDNSTDILSNIAAYINWQIEYIEKSLGIQEKNIYEDPGTLMGVAMNGRDDLNMLRSSLQLTIGGVGALLVIFVLQRKISPVVYAKETSLEIKGQRAGDDTPEQQADREVDDGAYNDPSVSCFDWVSKVWKTTPEEEVLHAGLDGYAFLEFRRLNFRILYIIGPILSIVLLPLHYTANSNLENGYDILSRLDIGNDAKPTWMLWVHACMVWLVVCVSSWNIVRAQYEFTERRYQWLREIPVPRAATVLVRNIPYAYRTDAALKSFFTSLFGESEIESAYIVRRTGRLPFQVQALNDAKLDLVHAKKRWEALGRPEASSREVEEFQERVDRLAREAMQAQSRLEEAAARADPTVCSASGFVTFTSELSQRLASREQCTREVSEFVMSMAPDPDDVIYKNVVEDDGVNAAWNWVMRASMLLVFTLWIPFVMVLSSWTTFGTIQEMFPGLKDFVQKHEWLDKLLSGVFATIVLKIFLAFLPSTMYGIITCFADVKSGAAVQIKMQMWYSGFLLIFVLLVTSLGRGLTITLVAIAEQPGKIFSLLAAYLPSASHFYFQYEILGWIVLFTELLRSANFFKYHFFRWLLSMSPKEAKGMSEPEDPACYGVGSRMASSLLTSAITFVFCSCSPLILVFSWVSFGLGQFTYGYLVVFAESKKPDTGGFLWLQAVNQLFWVLAIYVLLMTGVLQMISVHRDWVGPPVAALASLGVLFWARCQVDNLAFEALPLDEVVRASRERTKSEEPSQGQYVQPECIPIPVEQH
mmetsp:Transcript_66732/g.118038  ORF Transcript_66732/g.118038 Transcript_66732/m.118038 type:complete len:819 (-) Transcript_66732:52-2508(-)